MSQIQAILFDLEGVIIDTEAIWDEAAIEFLRRRGKIYNRSTTKHLLMGQSLAAGVEIMKKQYRIEGDAHELVAERRTIFGQLLEREVDFMPGFKEFFAQVKPSHAVAIATSLERGFLKAVDHKLHLSQLFDQHIYSIEDIGHIGKPNPDIFLYAAKNLGIEPAHCLVIEDASNGVEAAHRAGMRCAAIVGTLTREHLAAADQVVGQFSEIIL